MLEEKTEFEVPKIEVSNYSTKYLQLLITDKEKAVKVFIDPCSVDGLIKKLQSVKLDMEESAEKSDSRANY